MKSLSGNALLNIVEFAYREVAGAPQWAEAIAALDAESFDASYAAKPDGDWHPSIAVEQHARKRANAQAAYAAARSAAAVPSWRLTVEFIDTVHAAMTAGLWSENERNRPGMLRGDSRIMMGGDGTGGTIYPPQYGVEVVRLLGELVRWQNEMAHAGVSALLRAPLFHVYFGLMHPYFDGNGRTCHAVESAILLGSGYRIAPFALSAQYFSRLSEYGTALNGAQCAIQGGDKAPCTDFVEFWLRVVLRSLERATSMQPWQPNLRSKPQAKAGGEPIAPLEPLTPGDG
jgi:Fic family protein